jgi:tetratricopeptide (TPR) repeat protein
MSTAQRPLRRFIIAAFWLAALSMPLAKPGFADSFEADGRLCNGDGATAEDKIAACTRQIETGRLKEGDLALAYYNRANNWKAKNELDRAIADFDEAIRRDPKDAKAYDHRAMAYRAKGDASHAAADHAEAVRLDPNRK